MNINPFIQSGEHWFGQLYIFLLAYPALAWALVLAVGLVSGSFLGCLVYRLPKILLEDWKWQAESFLAKGLQEPDDITEHRTSLSLWYPPSHCPSCEQPIGFWGLLPLLGYLICRGKCRHCKVAISWDYPLIELIGTALTLWCFAAYGISWMGLLVWVFSLTALALAWIDARTTLLPDQLLVPLLWLGLIANYNGLLVPFSASFWGCIGAYVFFALISWLARVLLKRDALGGGDVKLFAAIAAWLGWEVLPLVLFLATASAIAYLLVRKATLAISVRSPLAFGAFLLLPSWLIMQLLYGVGLTGIWQ